MNTDISHSIILFDDTCILCNKYAVFIAKNDIHDTFRFATLNGVKAKEISNKLNIKESNSVVLVNKIQVKYKSDAVLAILSKLKFPYNLAFIFYIIPFPIRDYIYDLIANNRYKWFGNQDECSLEIKDKLIN